MLSTAEGPNILEELVSTILRLKQMMKIEILFHTLCILYAEIDPVHFRNFVLIRTETHSENNLYEFNVIFVLLLT